MYIAKTQPDFNRDTVYVEYLRRCRLPVVNFFEAENGEKINLSGDSSSSRSHNLHYRFCKYILRTLLI